MSKDRSVGEQQRCSPIWTKARSRRPVENGLHARSGMSADAVHRDVLAGQRYPRLTAAVSGSQSLRPPTVPGQIDDPVPRKHRRSEPSPCDAIASVAEVGLRLPARWERPDALRTPLFEPSDGARPAGDPTGLRCGDSGVPATAGRAASPSQRATLPRHQGIVLYSNLVARRGFSRIDAARSVETEPA